MNRSSELIEPPLVVRSSLAALAQPNPRPNKSNLTLEGFLGGQLVHDVQEIVLAVALTLPFPFPLFLLVVVVVLTCRKKCRWVSGKGPISFVCIFQICQECLVVLEKAVTMALWKADT